ncbi:hypothetical protein Bbelb_321360 [Branchiostoma belcheri]|nr:hypothetical protein Bbelb_321360 [Branchiostoma belcheri]
MADAKLRRSHVTANSLPAHIMAENCMLEVHPHHISPVKDLTATQASHTQLCRALVEIRACKSCQDIERLRTMNDVEHKLRQMDIQRYMWVMGGREDFSWLKDKAPGLCETGKVSPGTQCERCDTFSERSDKRAALPSEVTATGGKSKDDDSQKRRRRRITRDRGRVIRESGGKLTRLWA